MRVSSVTRPCSSSGTLKSTRMKTRLCFRSRSRMDNFAIAFGLEALLAHEVDHVAHAAGVSPLIVVPGDDFDTVSSDNARHRCVNDGRSRITAVVHGD